MSLVYTSALLETDDSFERLARSRVLGVVLAGGRSVRFGVSKPSVTLRGKTLLDRVCERAAPQVDRLLISIDGNATILPTTRYPMLLDEYRSEGPLVGVLSALAYAAVHDYSLVATFPCDTPFLPGDLVRRLFAAREEGKSELCVARRGSEEHPLFSLWNTECRLALAQAFAGGFRSIRSASTRFAKVAVDFPPEDGSPACDSFYNINTVNDLEHAEMWLTMCGGSAPNRL